jgi:hypothetical protein
VITLTPVVAALKLAGTPFKFVGGAIDLVTAGDYVKTFPSAYVLPLADSAGPNQAAVYMASVQPLTERFGVMYAFRNVRPGAGDKVQEEARVAIDWARSKVQGLQIDQFHDLVALDGGQLVSFADELMIWMDSYSSSSDLRKT